MQLACTMNGQNKQIPLQRIQPRKSVGVGETLGYERRRRTVPAVESAGMGATDACGNCCMHWCVWQPCK